MIPARLDYVRYGESDVILEKLTPLFNELTKVEINESFLENWHQIRVEIKEISDKELEEMMQKRKEYEAQKQKEADDENNDDSKESDSE